MTPQGGQQVVDAQALANSIVQGVFARLDVQGGNGQQAAPTKQERVDHFKAEADALLKDGKLDQDVMPVMLRLIEAMGKDLSQKQQEQYLQSAQEQQTRAIHSEMGRIVERYAATCANPELIRELSGSIVQRSINDYNGNAALVRAYRNNGAVDWTEMDRIIVGYVNKWSGTKEGGEPRKPAGGPTMSNAAPSGAADVSTELSEDSLSDKQLEMFNAQVSFAIKQRNMNREDARKHALKLINNAENKRRSAKR